MRNAYRRWFTLILFFASVGSWEAIAQVAVATVPTGVAPYSVAVNAVTNKIYFADACGTGYGCAGGGAVTVLDGTTLAAQNIPAGVDTTFVAVNPVTNKIYAINTCGDSALCQSNGTVTVIDGATLATQEVQVGWIRTFWPSIR